MSDGLSKLIAINEEPNHQLVHGCRFGEANGVTHETPNRINLIMPAECVSKSPHGICARECVSPMQVRLLRAQRMWGSAKPLGGDQENP